ncbi:hypothetical protein [Streptomyces sp. NPDC088794]|uniref:hypothetical protein n=1 Tax=Streptomyces sp. NPDC088794 TaxID=3365902 RepID=UPI00381C690F
MRTLHVHHVKDSLRQDFTGLIDLSDVTGNQSAQSDTIFLSRALAARAVDKINDANYDWTKEMKRVHKVTGIALEHLRQSRTPTRTTISHHSSRTPQNAATWSPKSRPSWVPTDELFNTRNSMGPAPGRAGPI